TKTIRFELFAEIKIFSGRSHISKSRIPMKSNQSYDAIIIGAGVVGCSIAYHLTQVGFRVALIEQKHVGSGASGANFGMVQSNDVEINHSIPMVMTGYARFDTLEEELGMSLEFKRIASLRLLSSET